MAFDLTEVRRLLELQHGVISRRQVRSCGGDAHDVRRMIRRREWARVHPGVYVDHTGSATWVQRAQAAVLYAGPRAALDRESALEEKVRWNATPPRMRFEHATVDVALSRARDDDVIEVLAAAVRSRRTAASRLIDVIAARARVPRRRWLMSLLEDIRDGTASVLEHGYLVQVERAHGLPVGTRQKAAAVDLPTQRTVYRDVDYEAFALLVELDGRLDECELSRFRVA